VSLLKGLLKLYAALQSNPTLGSFVMINFPRRLFRASRSILKIAEKKGPLKNVEAGEILRLGLNNTALCSIG
jgi:hypothetical protein